eukprot:TRINITY_DN18661_c0_g1_i1.p1 TRINITY_DN18661_c0_g1~~TRINITY_DN18661_c0_g1_i1.p1  ORF type:complete len:111 (+),score=30.05 TRINITY_DN18661_c0_g1_i1:28-333(+)
MVGFTVYCAADVLGRKENLGERFYERPSLPLILERFERVMNERHPEARLRFKKVKLYDPFADRWVGVTDASSLYDECQLYLLQSNVHEISGALPPPVLLNM